MNQRNSHESNKDKYIITNVSQAYWYNPKSNDFQNAKISQLHTSIKGYSDISWLDKLFEGGIKLPNFYSDGPKRALSILLTGPPGSGKSTLALELCYRWANIEQIEDKKNLSLRAMRSIYITSESSEDWLIEKAKSYGWPRINKTFVEYQPKQNQIPLVTVWQTEKFEQYLDFKNKSKVPIGTSLLLDVINRIFISKTKDEISKKIYKKLSKEKIKQKIKIKDPDVIVIDSLNTVESNNQTELFNNFMDIASCGPKIIILILDSDSSGNRPMLWEFISDIVIKLDRDYVSDYMIRSIEIMKARYQSHIWGPQQLKIYSPQNVEELEKEDKRLAHPFRKEGGIFIYPSIHYYLSSYKRRSPIVPPEKVKIHLSNLNNILYGGFPMGRCVGFIGTRGGHKSHLGYVHLLSRIYNTNDEKAIVVSLRDDEGMAKKTMSKILSQEFNVKEPEKKLDQYLEDGRLEILYYPPGYITPEEFFHRMFMSINCLKYQEAIRDEVNQNETAKISLLFNSLDQLSSRFPLCAREEIFVPGIIETLSAEKITSIFIAVEEPGQPPEQYGLLSMADVLINFNQRYLKRGDYCNHLNEGLKRDKKLNADELREIEANLGTYHPIIDLRVVRFAGGQAAGSGGILELIDNTSPAKQIYKRYHETTHKAECEGLYFTECCPSYSQGLVFVDR